MTLADYMDPARFPETTQAGLTPQQQMMIDAMNYDELAADREAGKPIPPALAARVAELDAKHAARPAVGAELKTRPA